MKPKLISLLFAASLAIYLPPCTAAEDTKLTRLRVSGVPKGTFQYGSRVYLKAIEAEVRNVGREEALNIQVHAQTPSGGRVRLYGPSRLLPNKSSVYSTTLSQLVTSTEKIEADANCDNCMK